MAKKALNRIAVKYSAADLFDNIDILIDNGNEINESIEGKYIFNEDIKNDSINGGNASEYDYWAPMEDVTPVAPVEPVKTPEPVQVVNEAVEEPTKAASKKELAKRQKEESKRLRAELRSKKEQEKAAQKEKEEYVNKDVVLEKKSFKEKMNDFSKSVKDTPNKIKGFFTNKISNSTFVKDANNKAALEREALLINFEGDDAVKSDVKVLYEYVAKDPNGKTAKGYFEAYSKVEVHSYLLSEGYEVYSIRTNKWIRFLYGGSKVNTTKVKVKDLIFFLTQLSTYIKAGIPLVESLKILSRQFRNKSYKRIFEGLIYDLTMGDNFSDALSKQGEAFPKLLINMVKASEMTGELPEALDDMADYYTETDKTRKQMVTAMMYPTIIFVVAVGVITFILLFVIPKFVQIYESMDNAEIPAFTLAILGLSEFMQDNALWIFIAIVILCLMFTYLYKTVKDFKRIVQLIVMKMPVFGNVVIYNEVTMFTKTFSSLLSHNVFITDSMDILNRLTNNEIYKSLILDTITNLARGEKISSAFKDHWAFPIPAYEMIVTGERTGQLAEMMAKVSSYYQEMHRNAVTRIKTFVEPVLIVILTVVVGVIVLAIVIPMFSMYSAIQA